MSHRILAFLIAMVLACVISPASSQVRRTLLVRIDGVKLDDLLKTGVVTFDEYEMHSLLSIVRDTALALLTPSEAGLLRERGFHTSVIMEDTSEFHLLQRAVYGPSLRLEEPYHTYASILHEIDSLQRKHPTLMRAAPIGVTLRKRPIVAVKISRDVTSDTDRPAILFNGCHHSNEVLGAEICLAVVHELLDNYRKDPEITRWVDQFAIYVVPVVNVDGHEIVTSGGDPRWRKHARDTDGDGVIAFPDGVDLNRPYDFN